MDQQSDSPRSEAPLAPPLAPSAVPAPPPAAPSPAAKRTLRRRSAAAAVTLGLIGGGLIGGYAIASAATSATPSASPNGPSSSGSNNSSSAQPPNGGSIDPSKGGHTANGITETLLTGDTASKVTAAAQAAVPGATIQRVETDAEGSPYEAHMVKSDGTLVTVKVDDNFKVTNVINGLG